MQDLKEETKNTPSGMMDNKWWMTTECHVMEIVSKSSLPPNTQWSKYMANRPQQAR